MGCVYFHTGIGLEGPNLELFWQIRLVIRLLKLPFIFFGDFNIPIQEFVEHGWAQELGAQHPWHRNVLRLLSRTHLERR